MPEHLFAHGMKTKWGLAVADNVNRISIENCHKCYVYWVLKSA